MKRIVGALLTVMALAAACVPPGGAGREPAAPSWTEALEPDGVPASQPTSAPAQPASPVDVVLHLDGQEVLTLQGEPLGTVDHLMETGANDVLVVRGERERLIPFVQDQVVIRVDLEKGEIQVDWDKDF